MILKEYLDDYGERNGGETGFFIRMDFLFSDFFGFFFIRIVLKILKELIKNHMGVWQQVNNNPKLI